MHRSAPPSLVWRRPLSTFLLLCFLASLLPGCSRATASAAPGSPPAAQASGPSAVVSALPEPSAQSTAQPFPTSASVETQAVEASPTPVDDPNPLLKTTNILLLGSDRRPNMPNWRTDVIMIVAVDRANKRVGVISLPRDIYVDVIPGHRGNKINVIDYLGERDEPNGGGPKLLGQVIEDKLGVPIHHYVRVEFEAVKRLVDAMGGVEIEIDCPLYDPYGYDQGGAPLALDAGVHRLNGGQALSYVRSRRIGGDLERERRQQRFIWAVRTQIQNENLLPRIPAIYQALQGSVYTDLNLIEAVKLVRLAMELEKDDVHGFVVNDPSMIRAGYAGAMWVWYPNWPKIAEAAQKVFEHPALFHEAEDGEFRCP
ncbi:MAG: LCP family protein [Caldilinea sp.]|nr:LCP family protein [Caldilinea sp.]MDW8441029.1 LCP family protein [Caldilineaceae bacterium]